MNAIISETEFSRTYVRPDNTAVLTCPLCRLQKAILAEPYRGKKHKLKIKCLCTNTFKVFLEFRKRPRKQTRLKGTFINHSQNGSSCDLFIRDLSVIGLTFTSIEAPTVKTDDELTVKFSLDDEHQTEIRNDVIVRNVRSGTVGGEFEVSSELALNESLGHYIMHKL
jgi:hypothetical protein